MLFSRGVGPESACSLLEDLISRADSALESGNPAVDLRFGHDTNLLRLLALMGIEGADAAESEGEMFWRIWKEYELSPMAANLQLYFFRNSRDEVLVKAMLNEKSVRFTAFADKEFVEWKELRKYLCIKGK